MENFNVEFQQRMERFINGPVLYAADPQVPKMVSAELADFAASGVPDSLLKSTIETYLQRYRELLPSLQHDYQIERSKLVNDIQNSPLTDVYRRTPSRKALEKIVSTYDERAPRHLILQIVGANDIDIFANAESFDPLNGDGLKELYDGAQALLDIGLDEPDLQKATSAAQKLLKGIDNAIVQYVLVVGFTPEGYDFGAFDFGTYTYDRTLTSLMFTAFKAHMPFNPNDGGYGVWWQNLYLYVSTKAPEHHILLTHVLPSPSVDLLGAILPKNYEDVVELAGEAFAALCTVFKTEAAQQIILPRLAHMYIEALLPDEQPFDQPFRNWAWNALPGVSRAFQGLFEKIGRWIHLTKKTADIYSAPATILSPIFGLFYTFGTAVYEVIDKIVDLMVYGFGRMATPTIRFLREYLYLGRAWASVVLPGARRRPKSVWALLFVNDFTRLDAGTRFALSCKLMQETPMPTYSEWLKDFQSAINDTGLGDFKLFEMPAIRPLRLPSNPYTVDEEVLAMAPLFPGQSRHVDFMAEKLTRWVEYNVPQGIDGQWFATPQRVASSIRRYNTNREEPDEYTTSLMRRTVHALVNKYPEMYAQYRYFTLETARRRLKWDTNMSPGLGFMGNLRSRKLIRKHGFLDAMMAVATKRLREGVHPGSVAHVFVKEQVVKLDALLKGKNIRTVTAMDLMSNTLALPWSIELSRAPPPEAYILNALPRSEGGYRPIFEALRQHPLVLQADAHEFDSKLPPVITVEGLAELRSLGHIENPAFDVISSQIRSHYLHMRHSALVDLTTGNVFDKNGGLLTGQVNTSYDNRDAFRLMIISAWAAVSGREPETFWDTNTLGNAGDDDVIGSDEPRQVWLDAFKWIRDHYGVVMELEQEGWDNLSITALQPTPEMLDTAYYRAQLGMPTVTFGIKTEPAKLLLAKTEFRARHARLTDIPFRMAHVDSMIGSAYLTAYNPEIYQDFADLYLADMKHILLRFFSDVDVTEHRDKFGNIAHLSVHPGRIRPRYAANETRIRSMFVDYLKKSKWPSYQNVFNIWVRPYSVERSSIAKHYRTLTSHTPALPVAYKMLYGLVGVRETLYMIPNHVVRALPEFPGADVSVALKTPEFIIERFVWLGLFKSMKRIPTKQAFLTALREGPYAAAASPNDFLEYIEAEANMQDLIKTDFEILRGQAIAVTLVYSFLEIMLNRAAQTPFLGILVSLYALATRDVNRLYATANHVYWLSKARSSWIISNLMPADPYAWMKQVSVILVSGIPARWLSFPGIRHLVDWAPALVEAWVMASATVAPNVGRLTFREIPKMSPWSSVIDQILIAEGSQNFTSATVVAPTGSGKSTLFVALLKQLYPTRTIWLLHPTKAARDEYTNDFLPDGFVQILTRGIDRRNDASVLSVTYGYFVQLITTVLDTDVILFDEVHLSTTEMWVAWYLAHNNKKLCMTATPKFTLQPKTQHVFNYPGQRRFKMKMTYVNQTFETLFTTLVKSRPELLSRALIICPTLAMVSFVRNTISRLSYSSSELSSDNPTPARSGIIVATSIADQALTIEPPPSTVIDLGTMLHIERSNQLGHFEPKVTVTVIPVSQEVADQRAGRGGRASDAEGFGLVTGPRTPHQAPPRFPTSVYMHDEVVDNVLSSLRLRNALTPLHEAPGLLKYVSYDHQQHYTADANTLALVYVGFLYLSAGSDKETFKLDFLNYKHADLLEEQLRVYESQVNFILPNTSLINGNIDVAIVMLLQGVLYCSVEEQKVPCACLLFDDGWLTPCGTSPEALFSRGVASMLPSLRAPIITKGLNDRDWLSIRANYQLHGLVDSSPTIFAEHLPLFTFVEPVVKPPLIVHASAFALITRVERSLKSAKRMTNNVYLSFQGSVNQANMFNINVTSTVPVLPMRNSITLDLSDLHFNVGSFAVLAFIIACGLSDDQLLIVGQVPYDYTIGRFIPTRYIMIWGPPDEACTLIIPPSIARLGFAHLSHNVQTGSVRHFLATSPVAIMEDLDSLEQWQRYVPHAVSGVIFNNKLIVN